VTKTEILMWALALPYLAMGIFGGMYYCEGLIPRVLKLIQWIGGKV